MALRDLLFKVWSAVQQYDLRACQKCRLTGPTPLTEWEFSVLQDPMFLVHTMKSEQYFPRQSDVVNVLEGLGIFILNKHPELLWFKQTLTILKKKSASWSK